VHPSNECGRGGHRRDERWSEAKPRKVNESGRTGTSQYDGSALTDAESVSLASPG